MTEPSPPEKNDERAPRAGPPDSFARLFLEGLSKYRKQSGKHLQTATEEAASNLAQKTAPARAPTYGLELRSPRAILETIVVTAGIPAIGFVVDRADPFFLHYKFSWIVFAPLLVALRHGFTLGFASAAMLDLALVVAWRMRLVALDRFPGETFVGLIAAAMVIGQFSDVWKREIMRLDAGFGVLRKQNNELMRSHFLLELSHDRLDEQIGRSAHSLREAMIAVRELAQSGKEPTYVSMGAAMMEVFAAYNMLEVGELYVVERGGLGRSIVALGEPVPTEVRNPLVVEAITTGQLTYVPAASRPDADRELAKSPLLAAVPFVDTNGTVTAILCIQAMPFISFEKRNLEAMATLAGHFADLVTYRGKLTDLDRGKKEVFEVRVNRALKDLAHRKVPSVVAFLWIRRGAAIADSIDVILGELRELEFPYVARDPSGNSFVYILLQMADEDAVRGLEARFEAIVKRSRGESLARLGVVFSYHVLQPTDSVLGLFRLFSQKAQQIEMSSQSGRIP